MANALTNRRLLIRVTVTDVLKLFFEKEVWYYLTFLPNNVVDCPAWRLVTWLSLLWFKGQRFIENQGTRPCDYPARPEGATAHSPGQRPGWIVLHIISTPCKGKSVIMPCNLMLLPFQGVLGMAWQHTQGVASLCPGLCAVALSGRISLDGLSHTQGVASLKETSSLTPLTS